MIHALHAPIRPLLNHPEQRTYAPCFCPEKRRMGGLVRSISTKLVPTHEPFTLTKIILSTRKGLALIFVLGVGDKSPCVDMWGAAAACAVLFRRCLLGNHRSVRPRRGAEHRETAALLPLPARRAGISRITAATRAG